MLELYIEYEPEYVQSSLLFKEGDEVWLFGSVSNRTPGLVALQEALNDWNAKQAYIAQYAAPEEPAPEPSLQGRIDYGEQINDAMSILKRIARHEDAPPAPETESADAS